MKNKELKNRGVTSILSAVFITFATVIVLMSAGAYYLGVFDDFLISQKQEVKDGDNLKNEVKKDDEIDEVVNEKEYTQKNNTEKKISLKQNTKQLNTLKKIFPKQYADARKQKIPKTTKQDDNKNSQYKYEYYDNGKLREKYKKDKGCYIDRKSFDYIGNLRKEVSGILESDGFYHQTSTTFFSKIEQERMMQKLPDDINIKIGYPVKMIEFFDCKNGHITNYRMGKIVYKNGYIGKGTEKGRLKFIIYDKNGGIIFEEDLEKERLEREIKMKDVGIEVDFRSLNGNIMLVNSAKDNPNFIDICDNMEIQTGLKRAIDLSPEKKYYCYSTADDYIFYIKFNSKKWACVNKEGYFELNNKPNNHSFICE